ncbi:MAG: dihydroorotate dehydrogenase electron transfer subunit [SAR324 cluster bacterium]|uniref:Dihydroorotate dehydrogenase electron transfer subunit n=1 Tax=SAR324 cluster bacterium TaxID=2024889 RepID=A0A7X9IJX2_9DELT|nr:dihydroorotate dehydrogenase electron transfer subunit [SAR324 cluster bacterium]
MNYELPNTVRIQEVIDEAEGMRSLIFPRVIDARPGQFVMLWVPGVDAKPVGVSYLSSDRIGVTVSVVGAWSEKVCSMKPGEYLGLFGPYGNGFELEGKCIAIIGGGYGTASLMLLVEEALRLKYDITLIVGARTEKKLLYLKRIQELGVDAIFTTDDGSFGRTGTNLRALEDLLKTKKIDTVYGCGPELMEKSLAEFCVSKGLCCYVSLERHMKCGFGVCGACSMDPSGKRVCCEGPVFRAEEALEFTEFGKYHRDGSAAKHYF